MDILGLIEFIFGLYGAGVWIYFGIMLDYLDFILI